MIQSAADIIRAALITGGIVTLPQTIYAEDMYLALDNLNMMVALWNRERWMMYNLVDTSLVSTGAQFYTIGPAGDFDIPRPDRLATVYVRLLPVSSSQPFDFPLTLIESREDYSALSLKELKTWPIAVFLDSGYPLGSMYVWPIPPAGEFEIHIVTKNFINEFANLNSVMSLPPEYVNCIVYNLATRLRPLYRMPPDGTVVALAKAGMAVIRAANTQISQLRMPASILNGRAGFDPSLGNLNGLPWAY